ncbi:transformer-2 protein homolog beta-like [Anopheles stephensi]|uniref:Transformer-2 beta.1 n=2 Tax=Anopheles stephensi TaxID=30069 RepID=A0A2Z4HGQ6_ANOST|nr:transformer-2 protein homolog beta-like [Anopheles stephensi]AWW13918.1 transformer-2 beta.1 [Anopheles stephensi]
MTSSHRSSDRRTSRRYKDDYRRSRSVDRRHRSRRSRSADSSRDRYYRRSVSRSPPRRSSYRKRSPPSSTRCKIRVDSPEPSRCLGVFGLSVFTTEPYLNRIFCSFGTVENTVVIYDAKTRLSRGFGFVYFKTKEEAAVARAHCNGLHIHGRRMRVDYSITEQPHAPTPGVYMGRKNESRTPSPYNHRSGTERSRHRHRSRSCSSSSYYDK